MRVVVLYNELTPGSAEAERDVLAQRDHVAKALDHLGHETALAACSLDLQTVRRRLAELQPEAVFNLVESLGRTDRLMPLATMLLDAAGLAYTGSSTAAILATTNKLTAKEALCRAGLPTPEWTGPFPAQRGQTTDRDMWDGAQWPERVIIKPVWEHASVGIDDESVVDCRSSTLVREAFQKRAAALGKPCFLERYVDGREFNLSLLAGRVLPPAEISFSSFPAGKTRIVGHRAKWDRDSFEYGNTPRRFEFSPADNRLVNQLEELARRCWELFGLQGYARVDFRVDADGRPWILEINVNPCLAPEAGFAAALHEAGIPFEDAIQKILDDAVECGDSTP
jgi:D-alanine-D-alanine ligase